MDLVEKASLRLSDPKYREASRRFGLFNNDVEGAAISFGLFEHVILLQMATIQGISASRSIPAEMPARLNATITYHASCFVVAVRRAGRLLEALPSAFPPPLREQIKGEWQRNEAFFRNFIEPRNAIEHIDNEMRELTQWESYSLTNDEFTVSTGTKVKVDREALINLLEVRDSVAKVIAGAVLEPVPILAV